MPNVQCEQLKWVIEFINAHGSRLKALLLQGHRIQLRRQLVGQHLLELQPYLQNYKSMLIAAAVQVLAVTWRLSAKQILPVRHSRFH